MGFGRYLIVGVPILLGLFIAFYDPPPIEPPPMTNEWWGPGKETTPDDEKIHPFEIRVSESEIKELERRITTTRYFKELEDVEFQYGFRVSYMREVVKHWLVNYLPNWHKHQATLNKYLHYKTQIGGIMVHFIHVKPRLNPGQKAKPILLLHGWPGSVFEFYKVIDMLTNPVKYGATADDVFEVICPSIPGYGWSEASHKKGFDQVAAARIFHRLMSRLNFQKFYVQGGDWGAIIARLMSAIQPQNILGMHVNMFAVNQWTSPYMAAQQLIGLYFPTLIVPEEDTWKITGLMDKMQTVLMETGYMHLQSTKPDTVGHALTDSPVGLAVYIMEKFSTWANLENRNSPDGNIETHYPLDDVLTNVMIYWTTNSITSSMRFYKEFWTRSISYTDLLVPVPAGLICFPHELGGCPPKIFSDRRFVDTVQYTDAPKGGHFAALEQPAILAQDIWSFVRKVESRQ